MLAWVRRLINAFRTWMKANADAHAHSTPHSCCSAPPPGAGGQDKAG